MSVCPSIMATVSIPTPASMAMVAHVWRQFVMLAHAAPALLHAERMRRATVSGGSSQSQPVRPRLNARSLLTANLGSQHDRALRSVLGSSTTSRPATLCLQSRSRTSPVLRFMSDHFSPHASPRLSPSVTEQIATASHSWPQRARR